jgi:alanyl-tRNA synthetase
MEHAREIGAIAFFGDKYGDIVRVLEAGEHSVELCGGTHVHALGFIGPLRILGEGSIGSNLRRIEAVTGEGALDRIHEEDLQVRRTASLLNVTVPEVPERVERLLTQVKGLQEELETLRSRQATSDAKSIAANAVDGVVVERRDGLAPDDLRRLALAVRDALGSGIVVLAGLGPDGKKAGLVVGVTKDLVQAGVSAAEVAAPAAKALGGGTAKNPELVVGGGPKVDGLDEALALARAGAEAARG